ncbi:MAG: beta-propeller fold lactonase family protein, partial [Acidobacteria bacterium]|nr:beta-propeller fold lactonase family protein [Acidobacteriota bacterium]
KEPRAFNIDSTGQYLFVAGQHSHRLSSYRIEATGKLTKLKEYAMGKNPNWIEILVLPSR